MFNEVRKSSEVDIVKVAFVKSLNVQAFPCGRRRSELVDADNNANTTSDRYYIPYDPEARLNTEANNRKHSSLNGFTQSYLKCFDTDNSLLSIVLAGYLFNITLENSYNDINDFGTNLSNLLESNDNSIYANIRIEQIKLFEGFETYYTTILRNQSNTDSALTELDLLVMEDTDGVTEISEKYYFSGLSFSASSLEQATNTTYNNSKIISLKILEKSNDTWQLYQPSLLPKIEHGDTEDSVKMSSIEVKYDIKQNNISVPSLKIVKDSSDTYQLQFFSVDIE